MVATRNISRKGLLWSAGFVVKVSEDSCFEGVRRGRRDPNQVRVGDTLDFWRVEQIVDNSIPRLTAEMKVPGRAWLEFEVTEEEGVSTVRRLPFLIQLACSALSIGTLCFRFTSWYSAEC